MKPFQQKMQRWTQNPSFQLARTMMQRIDISAEAAALTYFLLLCVIPILLLMANIIPLLPLPVEAILSYLDVLLPDSVSDLVLPVLRDYLGQVNGSAISVGIIALLWSSSRALNRLQQSLNRVYDAPMRQNFFVQRMFSFLMTFLVMAVIGLLSVVFVFGRTIVSLIEEYFSIDLQFFTQDFSWIRWVVFVIGVFIIMTGIYFVIPNVRWSVWYAVPGGIFTTIGFGLISQMFTLYVDYFGRNFTANGTFGGLLIFMIWLYISCYVVIGGGVVNVYLFHRQEEKVQGEML